MSWDFADRFKSMRESQTAPSKTKMVPSPKRGEAIFENDEGAPKSWDEYVGQDTPKQMLKAALKSAEVRDTIPDHVLLASGIPGIGKSALARLFAFHMDCPYIETQGAVSKEEATAILQKLSQEANRQKTRGACWFIDEVHQLVSSKKEDAEWLLSLLQDGIILDSEGEQQFKNITVIAATTDKGTLPDAIVSRFTWMPVFAQYTPEQGAGIVQSKAKSIFEGTKLEELSQNTAEAIAKASCYNPRHMKTIVRNVRDAELSELAARDENGDLDLTIPLTWAGRDENGLSALARKIYITLYTRGYVGGRCLGRNNIASIIGESVWPADAEKELLQLGLIQVSSAGRCLTEDGVEFAPLIGVEDLL